MVDLATAHVAAIRRMIEDRNKARYEVFNIGTGRGVSVLELSLIHISLALAGGNKSQAAKLLGIDRKTLYNKLHLYGIE